jgi:hypothetical protein
MALPLIRFSSQKMKETHNILAQTELESQQDQQPVLMGGNPIDRPGSFMQPTWRTADLPFGGIKKCGCGRELSSTGIQVFVNNELIRTAFIDGPPESL